MPITAVLFDVDGVLLDSTAAHRRAWDAWSAMRGLDAEKVWELTFGRRPEGTVREVAPQLDPDVERAGAGPAAGAGGGLVPAGCRCGRAAGGAACRRVGDRDLGRPASVRRRFGAAGLPLPRVQVYGADVGRSKPAPDCFALAASRLGVPPSARLVVEEAPAGMRAGRDAGCTVVGLTTTHAAAAPGRRTGVCRHCGRSANSSSVTAC